MYNQYIGRSGKTYNVTEERINGGGEGNIYSVLGEPDIVAKIYKEDRRTKDREDKLIVMMRHSLPNVTWPKDVVYDQQGCFMGYIMDRLVNTKNLNYIYDTEIEKLTLRHRILIAYNLCAVIDSIHALGQVCGDLNPQNICVNVDLNSSNACRITLVDSDSYHIIDNNMTYRCEVGLSNYIAPELQNKLGNQYNLKTAPLPTYTKETDLFAMAVHIFALLMNGCHPFSCAQMTSDQEESVVLPQPIDNIKSGFFPFAQKKEGITIPLYAPAFESLPYVLQNLFIKTFLEGYYEPSKRATAKEWMEGLRSITDKSFYAECNNKHIYFKQYNRCPYCEVKQKMYEWRRMSLYSDSNNGGSNINWSLNSNSIPPNNNKKHSNIKWIVASFIIVLMLFLAIAYAQYISENNVNDDLGYNDTMDYDTTTSAEDAQKYDYASKIYQYLSDCKYQKAVNVIKEAGSKGYSDIYFQDDKVMDYISKGYGLYVNTLSEYAYLGFFESGNKTGEAMVVGDYNDDSYYYVDGTFKDGTADGYCREYFSKGSFSSGNETYELTIEGDFSNGLEDGFMTATYCYYDSGEIESYTWTSENGTREIIRYEDGNYIYAENTDNYMYYSDKSYAEGHGTPNIYY